MKEDQNIHCITLLTIEMFKNSKNNDGLYTQ